MVCTRAVHSSWSTRIRLLSTVPELRVSFLELQAQAAEEMAAFFAEHRGMTSDEDESRPRPVRRNPSRCQRCTRTLAARRWQRRPHRLHRRRPRRTRESHEPTAAGQTSAMSEPRARLSTRRSPRIDQRSDLNAARDEVLRCGLEMCGDRVVGWSARGAETLERESPDERVQRAVSPGLFRRWPPTGRTSRTVQPDTKVRPSQDSRRLQPKSPFLQPTLRPRALPAQQKTPSGRGFCGVERTGIEPVTSGLQSGSRLSKPPANALTPTRSTAQTLPRPSDREDSRLERAA